jgi:hypothetical protein
LVIRFLRRHACSESSADNVIAVEELPREGVVNHRHLPGSGAISIVESTAALDLYAHRGEELWIHCQLERTVLRPEGD